MNINNLYVVVIYDIVLFVWAGKASPTVTSTIEIDRLINVEEAPPSQICKNVLFTLFHKRNHQSTYTSIFYLEILLSSISQCSCLVSCILNCVYNSLYFSSKLVLFMDIAKAFNH